MHPHAAAAIRAAQNRNNWGRFATLGFLRNRGVNLRLYMLACALQHGL